LAYTIISILHFNAPKTDDQGKLITYIRTGTAWTIIGGACDLYLTCMIWFIYDDTQSPSILIQGDRSYAILNVAKPIDSSVSESKLPN